METVALYGRVSTAEQAKEGYSLGEQESRLKMYAAAHGWNIAACYMDGGFSGAKMERPGLQQLINDAKNHRITKVLVYKLDRLSRSQKDTLYLIEDVFLKNNVDFVSMSETIDTSTPFGIAMIGILSVFAQLERETIRERMTLGRDAAIKSGNYKGVQNIPMIGYKSENGKPVPDEYELSLVKRVFQLYADGYRKPDIARIMEESAPIRDKKWQVNRIKYILTNPAYIGKQKWKGEVYDCADLIPIIDNDLWEKVQSIRKSKSRESGYCNTDHKHIKLLGGLLHCGQCGHRYVGSTTHKKNGTSYNYYRCSNASRGEPLIEKCTAKCVNGDKLESFVIDQIKRISADRTIINQSLDTHKAEQERIEAIKKRLAEVQAQQKKLINLFTIDSIDQSFLIEKSESLSAERKKLETELINIKESIPAPSTINEDLDTFSEIINTVSNNMELYEIIHKLISHIILQPNGNIEIHWAI